MSSALLLIALILFALAGIVLAAFQLPGTWVILAAAIGYDWYFGFQRLGWKWLVALAAVAVIAEVLDSLFAVAMARKAGASRRAAVGALIGGFVGMFVLSLPMPVVGTIAGGLLGCFAGAFLAELTHPAHPAGAELDSGDRIALGTRVGVFAAIGRIMGLLAKMAAAFVIAGAAVALAIMK